VWEYDRVVFLTEDTYFYFLEGAREREGQGRALFILATVDSLVPGIVIPMGIFW